MKDKIKLLVKRLFTRKRLVILAFFVFLTCILYHNNAFYNLFRDRINGKLYTITKIDFLAKANAIAHNTDVIGKLKQIGNSLDETDYIDIQIEQDQQDILDNCLLKAPVKKKWVIVKVKVNDSLQLAKLKLHGTAQIHYMNNKYSYTIKLNKDSGDYVDNFRRFKLIKGEEADPTLIAINQLANDLGLISTSGKMKMLRINGVNKGYYYFVEDIKKEYLERKLGITKYAMINNVNDWTRKDNKYRSIEPHMSDNDLYFGHIEKRKNPLHPSALNQYKILSQHIENNNLEEVVKMFDIDYMGKFLALASVFNDIHFMAGDNLKLIYDFNRGKFYPIYRAETEGRTVQIVDLATTYPNYNKFLFHSIGGIYSESLNVKIFKTLLSDNEIRTVRDKYMYKFINQKSNFIGYIKNVHLKNEKIMTRCNSRRLYDQKKEKQLEIASLMLNLGDDYLNYGHVYGSYDTTSHDIHLLLDAFTPIDIYYNEFKLQEKSTYGIELSYELENQYNYQKITINQDNIKLKKIIFVNSLTKDTISKEHIHINYISTSGNYNNESTLKSLKKNNVRYVLNNNDLKIMTGSYTIKSNVVITSNFNTTIEKGVIFKLDDNINFSVVGNLDINGTEKANVIIKNLNEKSSFGTFSVIGTNENSQTNINYLKVSGGSHSNFMGRIFTGQFVIYNSNITLYNSTFTNSSGDDGINIKHSKIEIIDCIFINNLADQVDLDFCFATFTNCIFSPSLIDSNGDGLDLSGSYAKITNCKFTNFLDKGLSLGERSKVLVNSCQFEGNNTAIAIKDQTQIFSWDNQFQQNQNDYYSYIKKKIFDTPVIYLLENPKLYKIKIEQGVLHNLPKNKLEKETKFFLDNYGKFTANHKLSNLNFLFKFINT